MNQVTANATADTWMHSGSVNVNYGETPTIWAGRLDANSRYRTLLRFYRTFVSPTVLRLYLNSFGPNAANGIITIHKLRREDWVETEVTWSVYKALTDWGTAGASNTDTDYYDTPTATYTLPGTLTAGWIDIDVTEFLGDEVGEINLRVVGNENANNTYFSFRSREYGDGSFAPHLVVTPTMTGEPNYGEFALGPKGFEIPLSEPSAMNEDIVRSGVNHRLLNGMVTQDRLGVRHEWYIKWESVEREEVNRLRSILNSRGSLSFLTFEFSRHVWARFFNEAEEEIYELRDFDYSTEHVASGDILTALNEVELLGAFDIFTPEGASGVSVEWAAEEATEFPASWPAENIFMFDLTPGLNIIPLPWEVSARFLKFSGLNGVRVAEMHPLSRRFDVVQSNSEPIKYWNSGPYYDATLGLEQAVK